MELGLALIVTGVVFLTSLIVYTFYNYSLVNRQESEFSRNLVKMQQEYVGLKSSVQAIEELTSEYFVTANENGYRELCNIEAVLAESLAICRELTDKGRKREAEQILYFLFIKGGNHQTPTCLSHTLGEKTSALINWNARSKELIRNLAERIAESSARMKEVGSPKRRARKRTMMILEQVNQNLNGLN